jgi:hydroxymethylpyrimidine pyrophosphatase-like HAD family hydrolase/adenine/guanine phosphoribosyltransferase-like PRPP-binding protein
MRPLVVQDHAARVEAGTARTTAVPRVDRYRAPHERSIDANGVGGHGWPALNRPYVASPLELTDLRLDLDALLRLLDERIECADWLDSYLLCAGASQVLEDALVGRNVTGGRAWWRRVAGYLEQDGRWNRAGLAIGATLDVADRANEHTPAAQRIIRTGLAVLALADALAAECLSRDPVGVEEEARLRALRARVIEQATALPTRIRRQLLRLPTSFRSLDQHPADIVALVDRFVRRWPQRDLRVVVIGVRTSGSYLAPLAAAALRLRGYGAVDVVSLRSSTTPGPRERRLLAQAGVDGAVVVIVDDPPVSGRAVRAVADDVERFGVPPDRIVPLLALASSAAGLPAILQRYPAVILPWPDWHVHQLLRPDAVADALGEMLPGEVVTAAHQLAAPSRAARNHVLARYSVELAGTYGANQLDVAVEGAGLGFFGRHAVAVAHALPGAVPPVYGFRDGLVFRQWVTGPVSARRMSEPVVSAAIGAHVAKRHRSLPATEDRTRRMAGEQPVWEVASRILAPVLGRPGTVLRPVLVDPLVRELLKVDRPSVVDGRMQPDDWFEPAGGSLVKTQAATGAFSRLDLSSYDPIFDLAAAGVEFGAGLRAESAVHTMRRQFERDSGLVVDEERWLLYQLVHIWNAERTGRSSTYEADRAGARAMQRYMASVYLQGIPAATGGPLCAIDIDGVFESSPLGFSATTASGALALRALRAHGYRAVLVTGRCVEDVIDRCNAYQLAGGVAEYGAVVYDRHEHQVISLMSPAEKAAVEALQSGFAESRKLDVDPDYRFITRVRRRGGGPVPPTELTSVPGTPHGAWQFVVGEGQTDIVCPGIDKGRGFRALAARLSAPSEPSLAVGDTEADLPMLRLAQHSFAPGNARGLRDHGVNVLGPSYQTGLVEAVGQMIGHQPGRCAMCRPPAMESRRRKLLQLLSTQEAGPRGMPRRAARLAWAAAAVHFRR